MDPLSITTSAIALVGACRKLNDRVHFYKSLSRAPEVISVLSDEVHALQNTLTAIGLAMRYYYADDDLAGARFAPLFHRVDLIVQESCDVCVIYPNGLAAEMEETGVSTKQQRRLQLVTRFR